MITFPAALFGAEPAVTAAAGRLAGRIEAGASLAELVPAQLALSGLIVLQGGSPLIPDRDAHHVYALHTRLGARTPRSEDILRETLSIPWGPLALLGQDTQAWLLDGERQGAFLAAMAERAESFAELDGAFTLGQTTGSSLYDLPTNLQFVLAQRGLSVDTLRAPLPAGGWLDLVTRVL